MTGRQVVCTGMGAVTPLGIGVRKCWKNLLSCASGITNLRDEHSFEGCKSKVAAYVPENDMASLLADQKHSYVVKNAKQFSRATTMAMFATHEALEDSRLLDQSCQLQQEFRSRCGVTIGQGMVDFQDIYDNGKLLLQSEPGKLGFRKISPYFMTRALLNMSAGNVSIRYKTIGPNHCVSTACATGVHSIGDAFNFIRRGDADIMICGSTEASINSIAMAGFERLKALSTEFNENPTEASRPFDKARCGFVMGEGSGIIILEHKRHALRRGLTEKDMYCEILGYGTSGDGHHLTAPSPDGLGASTCMRNAIQDAKLHVSKVTHVNAHATSTPLGDDIECNAIEEVFCAPQAGERDPVTVTSCKGALGHLLGGAGSVESIFAILSCRDAILPRSLNVNNPLVTPRNLIKILSDNSLQWKRDDRILIKNSFGFGGTNASLVISNVR